MHSLVNLITDIRHRVWIFCVSILLYFIGYSWVVARIPIPFKIAVAQILCLLLPALFFIVRDPVSKKLLLPTPYFFVKMLTAFFSGSFCFLFIHLAILPWSKQFFPISKKYLDTLQSFYGYQYPWSIVWVCIAFVPAVCEEILFRLILLGPFCVNPLSIKKVQAVFFWVGSSVLFGFFHGKFAGILIPITMVGLILGGVALLTHSCLISIGMHMTFNTWSIVLQRAKIDSLPNQNGYAWFFLGVTAFLGFLGIKYLRKNSIDT